MEDKPKMPGYAGRIISTFHDPDNWAYKMWMNPAPTFFGSTGEYIGQIGQQHFWWWKERVVVQLRPHVYRWKLNDEGWWMNRDHGNIWADDKPI